MEWFWFWMIFVLVFLLLPLGYGWGYRRLGPPYPSYYGRRRSRGSAVPAPEAYPEGRVATREVESDSWGVMGDLVWVALAIALGWLLVAWIF